MWLVCDEIYALPPWGLEALPSNPGVFLQATGRTKHGSFGEAAVAHVEVLCFPSWQCWRGCENNTRSMQLLVVGEGFCGEWIAASVRICIVVPQAESVRLFCSYASHGSRYWGSIGNQERTVKFQSSSATQCGRLTDMSDTHNSSFLYFEMAPCLCKVKVGVRTVVVLGTYVLNMHACQSASLEMLHIESHCTCTLTCCGNAAKDYDSLRPNCKLPPFGTSLPFVCA
eukprot:1580101-Amphidinium_carterae.1